MKLKLVFVSSYLNHHLSAISCEWAKRCEYYFISTMQINEERILLGYSDMNQDYDWVVRSYDNKESYHRAMQLIEIADVVIFGSCPFYMVKRRIEKNRLTFFCSEHLFKNNAFVRKVFPFYYYKVYSRSAKYRDKSNYYLLCASCHAKEDYQWYGGFSNKKEWNQAFKWGYFPELNTIDNMEYLLSEKTQNHIILWCGRFLAWKHPELALKTAVYLKRRNISFKLHMVGNGPLLKKAKKAAIQMGISNWVCFLGSLPYDQVQKEMQKAEIFLFTSDRNEGWGAVLNESMGNACCVIANEKIGSVGYMLINRKNGYIYQNQKELMKLCAKLLKEPEEKLKCICKRAYHTVHKYWTPVYAASAFLDLVNKIQAGELIENDSDHPCAKA